MLLVTVVVYQSFILRKETFIDNAHLLNGVKSPPLFLFIFSVQRYNAALIVQVFEHLLIVNQRVLPCSD